MEPISFENSTTSANQLQLSRDVEILTPPSNSDSRLRNGFSAFARDFDDWAEKGVQISTHLQRFQEVVFKEEKAVNTKIQNLENDKLKEEIRRRAAEKNLGELQKKLEEANNCTKEHERRCQDLVLQATQSKSKIFLQNKRFSEMFSRWKESEQLAPFMESWGNGEGLNETECELQMLENNMDVLVKFGETMETVMKKEKVDKEKKITNLIDEMKKKALAVFSPNTQHLPTSTKAATSHEQATTATPVSKGRQEEKTKMSTRSSTSSKRKTIASSSDCSSNDATGPQKRGRQSEPTDSVLKPSIPTSSSSKQNPVPESHAMNDDRDSGDNFIAFTIKRKIKKNKARGVKS